MRKIIFFFLVFSFFVPSLYARERVIHIGRGKQEVWSLRPGHSRGISLEEGILNLFVRSRGLFSYSGGRIRIRDLNSHGHGFTFSSHHPRGSFQWGKGFIHWDARGITIRGR